MLKKIILALVMALCAVSFTVEAAPAKTAAIKVTQATREGTAKAFFKAVFLNKDYNAAWNLMSPAAKAGYVKEHGSEAKAKAAFKALIQKESKRFPPDMLQMLKDEMQLDVLVRMSVKKMKANDMVKIKGKWYINNL